MNAFIEAMLVMSVGMLALWKVTFILLIAVALHHALWKCHPQWRVLIWRGTWLGIVVTILASLALPAWEMKWLPKDPKSTAIVDSTLPQLPQETLTELPNASAGRSDIPMELTGAMPLTNQPPSTSIWPKLDTLLFVLSLWAIVAIFLLARWARSYRSLARLRRAAEPAPEKLTLLASKIATRMRYARKPIVLVSHDIGSPCSVSIRRPIILLPKPDDPDMKAILAHEIAHLRSRDLHWIWLMDWLAAGLWFHPLCWFMRREHLFACESTSDAAAANAVQDRAGYSIALARIALTVCDNRPATPTAASMAKSSQIIRRLRLLERPQRDVGVSAWISRLTLALAVVLSLAVGTMQFALAEDDDTRSTAERTAPFDIVAGDLIPHADDPLDDASPIVGTWKDDRGCWHRFAPNGWYIELRGDVRTFESWRKDPTNPAQWIAGQSKVHLQDDDSLVVHREGPIKELNLKRAEPTTLEIRSQLASESANDEVNRKRLEGIWVARHGEQNTFNFETWVRFAPDGSFTKVHWSEEGYRSTTRVHIPAFRLARFHGRWNLNNRLLDVLGASIHWLSDQSFIAQLKSYDDSGLWKGAISYEKPGDQIPDAVRELLLAESNEKNFKLLLGAWRSESDGGSQLTFSDNGRWQTFDGGQRRFGRWETTNKYLIFDNYRIHRILRLDDQICEYEILSTDKKEEAAPVRVTLHRVATLAPIDVNISFEPIKDTFDLIGPVEVIMTIKNSSEEPFTFRKGGRQRGARDNQFLFEATQDGAALPDIGDGWHRGGKSQMVTIDPGKNYEITVDMRKWFALDQPGTIRIQGHYEADVTDRSIINVQNVYPVRLTAELEITIAGEKRNVGVPLNGDAGKTFRGIDLSKAPSTTKTRDLPEIWEARPPGSVSFEIRKDVIVFPVGFEGVVYFISSADQYYIQSDPLGSSTMTFYGPFKGNPFETLKLAKDLEKEALQSADAELAQRARQIQERLGKAAKAKREGNP